MSKFQKKKTFLSFLLDHGQKDCFLNSKQKYQKTFKNFYEISPLCEGKQSSFVVLSHENKADIDSSIFFNFPFDKGRLKNIVCWFFEKHGQYKTLKFLEKLKEVGFGSATNAGISLGIDDLKIPNQKITLVSKAETKVAKDLLHYRNAKITGIERIQRLIYTWNQTNDTLKQEVVKFFETTDLLNPIYMMAFSGARGNMSQVRQLVGMRGLMSDPQGQIIDFPIQSNFREGLTLTEYLISTYGARKGIVDTALRTATAGYLTRRLVDVAQHTIVSKFDCGTMRGIFLFDMKDGKKTIYSFQNRLIGRVLAQNIEFFEKKTQKDGEKKQIAFRNQEIDSKLAQAISKITKKAFVRSPLTCETSRFVCQLCYGWSFSHGKLVSVGEAVGIIAAQSIGEPGTQLTMRTFHTGGVFAGGLTDQILAPFDGKIKYFHNIPGSCVRTALSEIAFFTKMPGSFIVEKNFENSSIFEKQRNVGNLNKKRSGEILRIPAYALLFCRNNEFVKKKQVLAQFSSVLKKMQYGRAEQTLYSTLAGEFVFGKSFFAPIQPEIQKRKISKNFNQNKEQFLLLEKRRTGDFSDVELKNDILWKSQNWTTVWVLSGNVFCDSLNTNFHFQKGDFFKKTSILKRVLWRKKKRYKYSLFGNRQIQENVQKDIQYLFALEKKKLYNSFSVFSFGQKFSINLKQGNSIQRKSVCSFFLRSSKKGSDSCVFFLTSQIWGEWMSKNLLSQKHFFKRRNIQTNFSIFDLNFLKKKNSLKAKKIFFYCTFFFSQFQKNISSFSNDSFNIEKNNDFVFIQNRSNRFFTDFKKLTLSFHPVPETKKSQMFKKEKIQKHLFFKFLNKRKNFHSPLFLNISTFFHLFQTSQKFHFFSPWRKSIHFFSERQFFYFIPSSKMKQFSFFYPQQKSSFLQFQFEKGKRKFQFSQFSPLFHSLKQQKERKKKIEQEKNGSAPHYKNKFFSSFFLNQYSGQKKKNFQNQKERKNIVLKKFLLRFPIQKISYQKFGYFSSFFTSVNNKKMENSFQIFSTFMQKEKFLKGQKNIGKRENLFSNENFFGKDFPESFSSCFFQNSCTNTGGIFHFSFFEHSSKKQRISHFLCHNFSDDEEKRIFLKPEFFQKKENTKMKTRFQHRFFLSFGNLLNFSSFLHKKENTKKSKKFVFSSESQTIFIFQIPTFSFLSIFKNSFGKPFFVSFYGKMPHLQKFLDGPLERNNQFIKKEGTPFTKLSSPIDIFKKETLLSDETQNNLSYFSLSSENGNGSKRNSNQSYFLVNFKKPIDKQSVGDTSVPYWKSKNGSFLTVVPVKTSREQKKRNQKIEVFEKNQKIYFFDFSKNFPPAKFLQAVPQGGENNIPKSKQRNQTNEILFKNWEIKQNNETNIEKNKPFFFYNFCKEQIDDSFTSLFVLKNQKQKNLCFDFYGKQMYWLPQENFMFSTSQILKQNDSIPSLKFFSCSNKKPFLFFVNRQGKKKSFCFDSQFCINDGEMEQNQHSSFSNKTVQQNFDDLPESFKQSKKGKKQFSSSIQRDFRNTFFELSGKNSQEEKQQAKLKKQRVFEGFVKIANIKMFQNQIFSSQKKMKKLKTFVPLCQKFSFYKRKFFKKSKKKEKNDFQKKLSFKFHKRIGNKKFENIQKLFLKKSSFVSQNVKKNVAFLNKYSKTQIFFGRHFEYQCFTCVPLKKVSSSRIFLRFFAKQKKEKEAGKKCFGSPSFFQSAQQSRKKTEKQKKKHPLGGPLYDKKEMAFKLEKSNFLKFRENQASFDLDSNLQLKTKSFLKNQKLLLKVEQGWPVFPFSLQNSCFKNHKKIRKKGHFFEKNLMFEQNNTLLEIVRFENPSFFSNSVNNCFIQTEKISFHLDFLQTNKKCRFISLGSLFENKKQLSLPKNSQFLSKVFHKNENSLKIPFQTFFHFSSQSFNFYQKRNLIQFFRPFQYKIFENPQNFQKFFQMIRIQGFSQIFSSSSCFKIFKKYHSILLNLQKKEKQFPPFSKGKKGFGSVGQIELLSRAEKNQNSDFEILSNFQDMYLSQKSSSFISFSPKIEQKNFKKEFIKKQKHQETIQEKNERLKKSLFFQEILKKERNKEKKSNFSFYPIQVLPIFFTFSNKSFLPFFPLSSFPLFSMNALKNTIEFQLCEKRGAFFDERFPFGNFFDFPQTSSFWLNKDSMNFLFSPQAGSTKPKKIIAFLFKNKKLQQRSNRVNLHSSPSTQISKQILFQNDQQVHLKESQKFIRNSIFQKSLNFYGSTEFLSPYEGELLSLFTHDMYWWKKASEISTLRKFEKLFLIVTKKDLFSVEFPFETKNKKELEDSSSFSPTHELQNPFPNKSFSKPESFNSLKEKQKHLGKLYHVVSNIYKTKSSFLFSSFEGKRSGFTFQEKQPTYSILQKNADNFFRDFDLQNQKKIKISSFITKYEKKIYTFQNLTIGYPSVMKKPFLGNFVVYGDNFFGSALQKPGQIIHFNFSSMTLRRGQPCFVSSNGILHFSNIPYIKKNVPLVTLPYQTVQAGDIVQGIPKVEQFFEARTSLQGRLFVSSLPILLKGIFERYKVLLPLEQATRQSFLKIQQIIVDGVQRVYRSQGVSITDKHLEVVVRQMTTKVQILHGAQTGFFPGELVNLDLVERINKFLMVKIRYEPVILGITRASLEVDSFLSASSFQQTTKILSLAAISRKKDFLKGLKENLLVGNLIPSGTGYFNISKKI